MTGKQRDFSNTNFNRKFKSPQLQLTIEINTFVLLILKGELASMKFRPIKNHKKWRYKITQIHKIPSLNLTPITRKTI